MLTKDLISLPVKSGSRVLLAYLTDLDDADWTMIPVAGMNPIAWQVGHLIASEYGVMEGILPGFCPKLPEGFIEAHPRDPAAADPSKFASKSEYLSLWDQQNKATLALIEKLDEAELSSPAPERMRKMCGTAAEAIAFMGTHTLMHVGQFVSVRRKAGKPVVV